MYDHGLVGNRQKLVSAGGVAPTAPRRTVVLFQWSLRYLVLSAGGGLSHLQRGTRTVFVHCHLASRQCPGGARGAGDFASTNPPAAGGFSGSRSAGTDGGRV